VADRLVEALVRLPVSPVPSGATAKKLCQLKTMRSTVSGAFASFHPAKSNASGRGAGQGVAAQEKPA
jgi:hypothetical protein